MTTLEALGSWGSFDLDNPFPLFAEVRELGARASGDAGRRARRLAGRPLRGGHGRAQRPAALQGHARGPGHRIGRRGRRSAGSGLRPAHAHGGPARPHPAPQARLRRLLPEARRGPAATRPDHRRRPPRRHRRPGPERPVDLVADLCLPPALHCHLRAPRRARRPTGLHSGRSSPSCSCRRRPRPSTRRPSRPPMPSSACSRTWSRPSRPPPATISSAR